MRVTSIVILLMMALFVVTQVLVGGKYAAIHVPLLWLVLNVAPIIYLTTVKKLPVNGAHLLGYTILLLATPVLQALARDFQDMAPGTFLLISCGWLIPAQVLLWLSGIRSTSAPDLRNRAVELNLHLLDRVSNELVPANRTEAALKILNDIAGLHPDEEVQVALISARFSAFKGNLISNLLDADNAGREQAHINKAILSFIGQLRRTVTTQKLGDW